MHVCQLQVREEAGELCQTLEQDEGKERVASEAADLLYHAMVLLNSQVRMHHDEVFHASQRRNCRRIMKFRCAI
jgi:phosphoribosyl-ATP pyrophosphohydrolase